MEIKLTTCISDTCDLIGGIVEKIKRFAKMKLIKVADFNSKELGSKTMKNTWRNPEILSVRKSDDRDHCMCPAHWNASSC